MENLHKDLLLLAGFFKVTSMTDFYHLLSPGKLVLEAMASTTSLTPFSWVSPLCTGGTNLMKLLVSSC